MIGQHSVALLLGLAHSAFLDRRPLLGFPPLAGKCFAYAYIYIHFFLYIYTIFFHFPFPFEHFFYFPFSFSVE
jgi:hypothetical protein